MVRCAILALGVMLACQARGVRAVEVDTTETTLRIVQAYAEADDITLLFEAFDAEGNPMPSFNAGALAASVGAHPAAVESVVPFDTSGHGIAYLFLVDISGTIGDGQFSQLQQVLKVWFEALEPTDQAAIMTFGEDVELVQPMTPDHALLSAAVDSLQRKDELTQFHNGVLEALEEARRPNPALPLHHIIVLFTDGVEDFEGGFQWKEVVDEVEDERVPIYAFGFPSPEPPRRPRNIEALDNLGLLARVSGGVYLHWMDGTLADLCAVMRKRIRQVFMATLTCRGCSSNPARYVLNASLPASGASDNVNLWLYPEARSRTCWWCYLLGLVALGLVIGGVVYARRRRTVSPAVVVSPAPPPSAPIPEPDEEHTTMSIQDTRAISEIPETANEAGIKIGLTLVTGGEEQTKVADLVGRAVLGSSRSCEIVFTGDRSISSRHCELYLEEDRVFVRDLGSRNGSRVNGVPIHGDRPLEDRDIIGLGRTDFRFSFL